LGGARDIEIIHRVGADAGKFRTIERLWRAAFGRGHDLANGAPAQTAGAEDECLEKAVIELLPVALIDEFLDASLSDGRVGVIQQLPKVFDTALEQVAGLPSLLDSFTKVCHEKETMMGKAVRVVDCRMQRTGTWMEGDLAIGQDLKRWDSAG
jgi:hypothetical protein